MERSSRMPTEAVPRVPRASTNGTRQDSLPLSQSTERFNEGQSNLDHTASLRPTPKVLQTRHTGLPKPAQSRYFSLAGSFVNQPHTPSYVDPGYYQLSPRYEQLQKTPLWGLAKTLPRVVRPGMNGSHGGEPSINEQGAIENKEAEIQEPGSSEAIPQLGMINDQREEIGKTKTEGQNRNIDDRGYGHQAARKASARLDTGTKKSQSSAVHSFRAPVEEKEDSIDEWQHDSNSASKPIEQFDEHHADIGDVWTYRIYDLVEGSSSSTSMARITEPGPSNQESNDVDLEAGKKDRSLEHDDIDKKDPATKEWESHNNWSEIRTRFREPFAECLATMIACLIGLCTNLSVITSNNTAGSYQSKDWAWGFGVMIGVYLAGGISGGHLNPVVSITLCIYRGFPYRKALVYIVAQILGGFLAGLITYGIYRDAITSFNSTGGITATQNGNTAAVDLFTGGTGKAFFTQPATFAGVGASFGNELVASAILICAILALGDDSNAPPGAGMHAFIVGLVVAVLTMAFGYTTGACMNPARDFGPRIVAAIMGYGSRVFTDWNAWWIYGVWGATITGGMLGGLLYDVFVFVGGESPVNYPRARRRAVKTKAKRRWWNSKQAVKIGLDGKRGKGR